MMTNILRFKKWLFESVPKVNIHQLHLEQLVFHGSKELENSINILKDIYDQIKNTGKTSMITVKYDGSPAAVYGIDPETKKFFVSGKSIFKKNPRLMYSIDDVKNDRYFKDMPEVQSKFIEAFKYLSKLNIKGIYQCDLMFTKDSKVEQDIDGTKYITFKPNTITYAVDVNSDLGRQIKRAKIGLVVHTEYKGKPGNLKPNFKINIDKLKGLSSDVWITDAYIKNQSGNLTFTQSEDNTFKNLMSSIQQNYSKLNKSSIDSLNDTPLAQAIETVINSYIREGTEVTNIKEFFERLEKYLNDKYSKMIGRYKTDKKKLEVQQEWDTAINNFKEQKSMLSSLLTVHNSIAMAKMMIVKKFEEIKSSVKTFNQTPNGFEAVGAEGFCAVIDSGSKVIKLVDRLTFSKNNFNQVKDWGDKK